MSFTQESSRWLDVDVKCRDKTISYNAYYAGDALNDLLEAVVDILDGVGEYDKYFGTLRSRSRVVHNCEAQGAIVWDFNTWSHIIKILIRDNPDLDLDDELEQYDFDKNAWVFKEEQLRLEGCVLLAVQMPINKFLHRLQEACQQFLNQFGIEGYQNHFGYPFPEEAYKKLQTAIRDNYRLS